MQFNITNHGLNQCKIPKPLNVQINLTATDYRGGSQQLSVEGSKFASIKQFIEVIFI